MYHQNIIAKEVFSEKKLQETKRRLKIEDQRRKTQDNQDLKNQEFFLSLSESFFFFIDL